MKKLNPLTLLNSFFLSSSLLFASSLAFAVDNTATRASSSTPINVLTEQQKLAANREQNDEDEGAQEAGEEATEQDLYQIELLVFAYVNTGDENSEIWRNPKRPDFAEFKKQLSDSQENNQPSTRQNNQQQQKLSAIIQHKQKQQEQTQKIERDFLDEEEDGVSEFESIMRKMTINGHYRTLKHLVWQQHIMPRDAQDLFYLQGGENYLTDTNKPPMDVTQNSFNNFTSQQKEINHSDTSNTENTDNTSAPYLNQGPGTPELKGTLHIYRSRFLHVIPDLWLTQFSPNDAGQCLVEEPENNSTDSSVENTETTTIESYTPLLNFNMSQRRRLRSGELHYLDHPRFGVLIVFNKVVEEKETTEDGTEANN